jgi:hypothetical protein
MAGSIMGSQSKAAQQAASLEYSNTLNRRKTDIINKYRQRAYEKRVDRVRDQLQENFSAANASWQTEQARFIEQMLGFSFQQSDMTKQLLEAEGYAAATETYGKSAERAAAIQTLGDYGRSNARFLESVSSAARQSGRNMAQISGQMQQADMNAIGTVYEAPMMEMAVTKYQPASGGLNSALTIMNGVTAGLNTAFQADKMFDFSKPPSNNFKFGDNAFKSGTTGVTAFNPPTSAASYFSAPSFSGP